MPEDYDRSSNRGRRNAEPSPDDPAARLPAEFATAVQFTNYERNWIRTHLATFHDKELILDVVRRIKAGKEATVYICTGHPGI